MVGPELLHMQRRATQPAYLMACFKLPRGLCEHINSLLRKFWWGSKDGERKTAWVSWDEMTRPKRDGGLGFRDIELFNLALLARQAWRMLTNPDSISAQVLKAVYVLEGNILTAAVGSRPSIVWRSICEGRDVLKLGVIRRIGDGKETQFFDNWLPRDHKLQPICERSATPPEFVSELINQAMHAWNIRSLLKLIFLLGDLLMCPSRRVMYDYLGTWRRRRLALSAMQLKIHGTIRSLIVAWRKQYGR